MKSLARKDRIGNFEIQRLMSAFNQAETLASQTMRRVNDTLNSVTVKID
jgi:hypothetical protein